MEPSYCLPVTGVDALRKKKQAEASDRNELIDP